MKFGLEKEYFHILEGYLIRPLKQLGAKVWIFGSRARGDHKAFSDIDILYDLPRGKKTPKGFLFQIKDQLESSDLPYKVDIVRWSELAESYKAGVLSERIEL